MPGTMKAAVVHEFGKPMKLEEVPVPEPGPGQILVEIAATVVCHTDLHAANGDWPVKPRPPFIPGHEGVGDFPLSIFDTALNGITVRGSIVGTRLDLQEALNFAAEGKVKATIETAALESINDIFARMHRGDIQGRIVLDFQRGPQRKTDVQ